MAKKWGVKGGDMVRPIPLDKKVGPVRSFALLIVATVLATSMLAACDAPTPILAPQGLLDDYDRQWAATRSCNFLINFRPRRQT